MTRLRRLGVTGTLGAVLAMSACGVPTGADPSTIAPSDVPYGLASPAPRASSAATPVPRDEAGWAYLVGADGALVPLARDSGAGTPAERLGTLLAALAAGPTDEERARRLSTALPPGVELSVAGIDGATATIDLSGPAPLPSGPASRQAVAQIVLTATSLPGVEAVLLTSEGERVEAPLPSGALTDEPLLPADYAVFLTPPVEPDPTATAAPRPPATPQSPAAPRPSATPQSPAPSTSTAAPQSTPPPPFVADTRPDTAVASDRASVTVTDVRVGRHEGFDRVVLVVDGEGLPGWEARYVTGPRSAGSGLPVEVAGDAVLQLVLTGVGLPGDTGVVPYAGPDPLSLGGPAVREVLVDTIFEGELVAFLGTAAERPFRVYRLLDPNRVVVEVLHQG